MKWNASSHTKFPVFFAQNLQNISPSGEVISGHLQRSSFCFQYSSKLTFVRIVQFRIYVMSLAIYVMSLAIYVMSLAIYVMSLAIYVMSLAIYVMSLAIYVMLLAIYVMSLAI